MSAAPAGVPVAGVLFDYGNTLITIERPERALHETYTEIAARLRGSGHTVPEVARLIRDVHDRVDTEFMAHQRSGALEEIDLVAAAARAYSDLGIELDSGSLDQLLELEQKAWWVGVTVDPEAIPTLDSLRAAGIRVGLCSNAPFRVRSMHAQVSHLGLREHLDAVTFSGEVGWRKPAPQIFEAALAALGTSAPETVMVGDSVRDDILGAHAAGLRAILYEPAPRTRAAEDIGAGATVRRLSAVLDLLGVGAGPSEAPTSLRRSL